METMKMAGIVAFAFGAPSTILSNRRIAEIASRKAHGLERLVYTQLDIRVDSSVLVDYTWEKPGSPPSTLRMARGAVKWAKRYGLDRLWVAAAKPLLWRALRDLWQVVRESEEQIEVCVCEEIERYPEDSWFCPDSTQGRVRSREEWDKREKIIKRMPFFIYRIVAR